MLTVFNTLFVFFLIFTSFQVHANDLLEPEKEISSSVLEKNNFSNEDLYKICKDSYKKAKDQTRLEGEKDDEDEDSNIEEINEEYSISKEYLDRAREQFYAKQFNHMLLKFGSSATLFVLVSGAYVLYRKRIGDPIESNGQHLITVTLGTLASAGYLVFDYLSNNLLLGRSLSDTTEKFINTGRSGIEYGIQFLQNYWTGEKMPEIWNPEIEIEAARLRYFEVRDTLPKEYQHNIEDRFEKLTTQFVGKEKSDNLFSLLNINDEGSRKTVYQSLKKIDRIMSIPQKIKPVEVDKEKLAALIENYSIETQKQIITFAENVSHRSKLDPKKKITKNLSREVLYLQGSSGTGKTYFIEHLAGVFYTELEGGKRDYGLPVIKVSLEEVDSISDLVGKIGFEENVNEGLLPLYLSNLPKDNLYKNAFIYFDEADKFLNGENAESVRSYFIKEFFNLSTRKLRFHTLGINAPIDSYNLVLVGNAPIFDSSGAFMERMSPVEFPGFEINKKTKITCDAFGKEIAMLPDFTDSEIENQLQLILSGIKADQKRPGVRTILKTLHGYIGHLSNPANRNKPFDFVERLNKNSLAFSDPYGRYEMLLKKFNSIKSSLTESIVNRLKYHFDNIRDGGLLNEAMRPKNTEDRKNLLNYLDNIETVMDLPRKVKDLSPNKAAIMDRLNELLRLYPEEIKEPIQDAVDLHTAMSSNKGKTTVTKNILYLWGEPGTGKSYLAEHLAQLMDLDFIEVDLKGAKYEDIFGTSYFEFKHSTTEKLSRFSKSFLKKEERPLYKNSVIFINEADKILNNSHSTDALSIKSMLLDILDTSQDKHIDLRELKIKLDMSSYLFIIVGNKLVDSEELNDRMTTIKFEGFGLPSKLEIAQKHFDKIMTSFNLTATEEDRVLVNNLLEYSHVDKKQASLRKPFKVIELYANWLSQRYGTFNYKAKLDMQDGQQDKPSQKIEAVSGDIDMEEEP